MNANRKATQQQVDEATDALNEAIDNLELKPVEPEPPTMPEKPGTPGFIGKWVDVIREIIGAWFGRGN